MKEAMLAPERLLEIEEKFGAKVERIVPVELDEETLMKRGITRAVNNLEE